ncbi:hypothetical protein OCHUTO_0605 [Orientia chuto str. Dubai]|uniref:Uncharacterized protein n=1 Tax=Orientia chuto str. Dubai TaxID=1359168 RepID=A0A0F3MNF0_9RICK|nr:hypothetical protein [Candidatus Orientia mediorientalis]KJV56104.1 hypothetical protein OCHUTO_0605 [Orientia chuto str. Dubai]
MNNTNSTNNVVKDNEECQFWSSALGISLFAFGYVAAIFMGILMYFYKSKAKRLEKDYHCIPNSMEITPSSHVCLSSSDKCEISELVVDCNERDDLNDQNGPFVSNIVENECYFIVESIPQLDVHCNGQHITENVIEGIL